MAKDILRQDVKDVIAAHKGGELGARSVAKQRVPAVGIGVKNATSSNVATGTPLKIDGFSQELEYDAALAKLLNDALYLAATAPDETTPVEQIATTLEPIPVGKLGRAEAAIFPARVTFPDGGDDYAFASATFVAASSGPFRIVAKSTLSAERVAVCALAKVAGSSEPASNVPIRMATVAAAWTQNEARSAPIVAEYYDADLAEYVEITARSPLSRYRDSLAAGTKVLVAQITSGNWILLNAECPE